MDPMVERKQTHFNLANGSSLSSYLPVETKRSDDKAVSLLTANKAIRP